MTQIPIRVSFRSFLALVLSFSLLALPVAGQPRSAPSAAQNGGQTAAERAAGTASLNFPPDKSDSVALQCDQLADPTTDLLRVGDGVAKIDADQALPICEQAAEQQPVRPRYQYLYGRTLSAAKRYPDAAAEFAAADRAGYALASYSLARQYDAGRGVAKDWEQALRFYFRAANAGMPDAFTHGGEIYMDEEPPNYVEARSWLQHAVQGGSVEGMADLGWLYETGNGGAKDLVTAANLYSQAAKGGSTEGLFRAGLALREGEGVQKDVVAGCQMLIQAAERGYDYAEQEAGNCYYKGLGVTEDHAAAFTWFAKAAQAGVDDSRLYVADMLDSGDGWQKDPASAVLWYRAAADAGNVYAMTQLGAHLRLGNGTAWNEAEAMQWFAKAAEKGYVPAETSLAMGYENGLGQDAGQGRQDYGQAFKWFSQAAQQADGYAELNLGVMYENGWGVSQDPAQAKALYARAASSPDPKIADLGSQYYDNLHVTLGGEPQRTVASSSKDSSDFWTVVIVGALAVGAISLLSSGGSSSTSADAGSTCCFSSSSSDSTPWHDADDVPDMAPTRPQLYDTRDPTRIPMGDLTDPALATRTPWPDSN